MQTKVNRRFLTILISLGVFALITLLIVRIRSNFQNATEDYDERIESLINEIVPAEATDIRFTQYSAFQSSRMRLRFTISSEELSNFTDNFCPDMEISEGGLITLYNEDDIEWWKPEDAEIYEIGSCVQENIEVYRVLIDKTNDESYNIYIR